MKRKRVLSLILCILSVQMLCFAQSVTVTIGNLKYRIYNNKATVLGLGDGVESVRNLCIPDVVEYDSHNYRVTAIAESAFASNGNIFGTLHLPENLVSIGGNAFQDCKGLTGRLQLPETLEAIGQMAFEGCKNFSSELKIPNSVKQIGYRAFFGCYGFTGSLRIPDSVETIESYVFSGCSGFNGTLNLGNSIKTIENDAFRNCNFTGVLIIPESVSSIGEYAFCDCKFIGDLKIPNSVGIISKGAFTNNGFDGTLSIGNSVKIIGDAVFENCHFSGSLVLPESLQEIGREVFYGCSGFTGSLRIPDSVERIGDLSFYGCSGFEDELILGSSVNKIGYAAFANCKFRGSLILPNSITRIDESVFKDCTRFDGELIIGNSITNIGNSAFENCSSLHGALDFPKSTTAIGKRAFYKCSNLDGNLTLPESVTSIGSEAFYGCSNLTGALIIPSSIKEIKEGTFSGCSSLNGILTIPESVTKIGDHAFSNCSNLTGDLLIPNTVESLGNYTFQGCSSFNGNLHIPENISVIGNSVFARCLNLNGELVLPSRIKIIGANAFAGCRGFTGCLFIPENVTEIWRAAFGGCAGFSSIKINAQLKEINEDTFAECTGINGTIDIPSPVEYIWWRAFQDVPADCIKLPASLKAIYSRAFFGKMPQKIICDAQNPPMTYDDAVFNSYAGSENHPIYYESVPLYVPIESIEKYKKQGEWQWFENIYGIGEVVAGTITLSHETLSMQIQQEAILVATILPETTTDKSVVWQSSDETVAIVDANGKVTAIKVGKATITATAASGISATCEVTVVETPAGSITVDDIEGDNLQMKVGEVKAIKVTVLPETTTDKTVAFESSVPDIASVDEQGNVKALALGNTTITITAKSGVSTSIMVTVVATPAGSLTLNKTEATLKATETVELIATILPETTTDKSVVWQSSDEMVATVDANGKVTAVKVGKATITATAASGISATCEVTVMDTPVTSVSINLKNAIIRVDEAVQLNATLLPETADNKILQWESSDERIATVDANGLVLGKYSGEVTIIATAASGIYATCKVTVLPRRTEPITVTRSDDLMVIMDGEKAQMSVNVTGGYAEGLRFTWTNKGQTVGTDDKLSVTGHSNGDQVSRETYSVHVVDICDGVTLLDQTYDFVVETWPRPSSSVEIEGIASSDNLKIRENNLLELSADTPTGGYDNRWNFAWNLNGQQVSNEQDMSQVMTMAAGKEQATENATLVVTATNVGPDGTEWGSAVSASVKVTVYRRPLTPVQLLRKGDGATHTMVAMSQLSEDELARLGYSFVYGYTDALGDDYMVGTTTKRYCRFSEDVYNASDCEKWVYTQWAYSDGSLVTSGKRYLDGRDDEDFDASDFSGNPKSKKIVDYSDPDSWIRTNGRGISITVENDSDTKVEIYTTTGQLVKSAIIPADTYSSIDFDANLLTNGVYIVAVTSGEDRVTKKVIIK